MRGAPKNFRDFRGGVNTKASPYLVAQNEARDVRNVQSTTRGSVRRRNGVVTFSSPAAALSSLAAFTVTPATALLGVTSGNDIIKIDTGGTASSIKGAATSTSPRWEMVSATGAAYLQNGTDTPLKWTGTGNVTTWSATSGTLPTAKYLLYAQNRVYAANIKAPFTPSGAGSALSDPGSTLMWSDVDSPSSWPGTNVLALDPNDGDQIMGIAKVGPYVAVFKRRKLFVIYDFSTGANRRISDVVGTCAHRSVAEGAGRLYFLTQDRGVYSTDGQSVRLQSDNIAPTLESINASARDNAAGAFFNDHYYLSVPYSTSTNDLTCDLDLTLDSWWLHSYAVNQWALWRPSTTLELYGADASGARVGRAFVSGQLTDGSANFTAYWKGPFLDFGAPYVRKRMRGMRLDGTGPIDVYLGTDFSTSETLAKASVLSGPTGSTFGGTGAFGGTGIFTDAGATSQGRVPTQGVARAFSLVFTDPSGVAAGSTTASRWEVDSYSCETVTRRD